MSIRTLLAVAVLSLSAPPLGAQQAGQVQIVVGAAELIDFRGQQKPIERGTLLQQGDRIVTSEGGLVQARLTDGTLVSVRMHTDMTIEQYRHNENAPKEASLVLRLARGALRSITGLIGSANPDGYKIKTPGATIGIRGTDHEPVFIPVPSLGEVPLGPPGTYDKVNSGATHIQTPQGSIDLRPGQVGFFPVGANEPPKVLLNTPDFFKKLDPKPDPTVRQVRPLGEGRHFARPLQRPGLDTPLRPLAEAPFEAPQRLDAGVTNPDKTLQLESAPALNPGIVIQPESSTLRLIEPTVIKPVGTVSPTVPTISPTTTVAPTSTTIKTLPPSLIKPILPK